MEAIVGIVVLIIAISAINLVFRGIFAAGRSVVTGDSFAESFRGIADFQARLRAPQPGEAPIPSSAKLIEVKGRFPVGRATDVEVITSLFDVTDPNETKPVISFLEGLQAPGSIAYESRAEIGKVQPDQGFGKWVRVGAIIPEMLQTPYGGERKLAAFVRLVDSSKTMTVPEGRESGDAVLWANRLELEHRFVGKGYLEAQKDRQEAQALSIEVAVAIAMADGTMAEAEGSAIRDWILRVIAPFEGAIREELRDQYNAAMKKAFHDASSGSLSLSNLTSRLNEIGEDSVKYEALELCHDVMAADGTADSREMQMLHDLGEALELDVNKLETMRDLRLVNLSASIVDEESIETTLGISEAWDDAKKRAHLRTEFHKWSNRLNSLPAGEQRENAQHMLNRIADARKKYG